MQNKVFYQKCQVCFIFKFDFLLLVLVLLLIIDFNCIIGASGAVTSHDANDLEDTGLNESIDIDIELNVDKDKGKGKREDQPKESKKRRKRSKGAVVQEQERLGAIRSSRINMGGGYFDTS